MKRGTRKRSSHARRVERKYLPEFVYGGIDGAVTTFAVVAGVIGASLSPVVVLILGFANLLSDGFSMAFSNYLSIKSENDLISDKSKIKKKPMKTAYATFTAFFLIGFIPLFSFVLASITNNSYLTKTQFRNSIILTGLALIIVGWLKGDVTGKSKNKSALQTLLIGSVASFLAFAVGWFIHGLMS